ncbi:MAG: tRNA (adenosine(37)-N6)-dimethylallyltransferase MiaA [Firmicutes bacterium]|nr:tRNA (adenosine(37)-N6)-dimethylallyltransferase MiaA [Bacillota bacterium]
MINKRKTVIIVGPTAVGKTEYAIKTAQKFNGEIVSADSMQIYKYMDIGSAKPTAEEQRAARHYLVDEIDPRREFSVAEYCPLAKNYIEKIFDKCMLPIISGGTGLYVNSLIYDMDFAKAPKNDAERKRMRAILTAAGPDYLHKILENCDPDAARRIHPNNTKKVIRAIEAAKTGEKIPDFENSFKKTTDYEYLLIGLDRNREELYERINMRVDIMINAGLKEEIQELIDKGLDSSDISMKGIGYKEIIDSLKGEYDMDTAAELIKRNTRRYAKRQLTWFRRYPDIHWFNLSEDGEALQKMESLIADYLST